MRFRPPTSGDVVAGVTVALVALPQSLAYAELAGMPPEYGLYALALPTILAAYFASPYLQTGPVALTALLTFGALQGLAEPGSSEYISMAALLALMVGGLRLLLAALRLGSIAYLLSEPVLMGFTTGSAILIMASQVPKLVDVPTDDAGVLADAWQALRATGDWRWSAVLFAALTLVCMFGGRRIHRLFPGVLVAVVLGVVISAAAGYDGAIVGSLDGGLFDIGFDFEWDLWDELAVPALAIAVVGFAEPASIARTFAAEERLAWDANREMLGQGVANVAAAVSGAFPVGGSFSRSSLNRMAGATSSWAGAITGVAGLIALPLVPLLEDLPRAVLGAIVVGAVLNLIRIMGLARLIVQSRTQAVVGIGTLVATLLTSPHVERGVMIGVGLSLLGHLWREMGVAAGSERVGDTLRVFPLGVLWFATAPQVDRLIRNELAAHPEVMRVVVDLAGVGRLDYTGAASLGRLLEELRHAGVEVALENVRPGAERAVAVHLADVAVVRPYSP